MDKISELRNLKNIEYFLDEIKYKINKYILPSPNNNLIDIMRDMHQAKFIVNYLIEDKK